MFRPVLLHKLLFCLVLLPGLLVLLSCSNASGTHEGVFPARVPAINQTRILDPDSLPDGSHFYERDSTMTYVEMKSLIVNEKKDLLSNKTGLDSVSNWFCNRLVYGLIPYWYGTPWTFEGYTAVPGEGTVACGYFVSTTLQHMGLKINRYKLAQQLPIHEALTLALEADQMLTIEGSGTTEIIHRLDSVLQNGLYFLGFDQSHVGFLLRENERLFVIHSNYIEAQGVVVEPIEESQAFAGYYRFYIVPLSRNSLLMEKWLHDETITVVETP